MRCLFVQVKLNQVMESTLQEKQEGKYFLSVGMTSIHVSLEEFICKLFPTGSLPLTSEIFER